jgi:Type II secretion system (T2SS), protein N
MKLKWLIIVGVLSAFLVGIAMIPASIVESNINQRLANNGTFRVAGGTIWSGSGTLVWNAAPVGNAISRLPSLEIPLQWSFAPLGIFQGRASVDVIADGKPLRGRARLGFGLSSVTISRADLSTSLEVISRFNRNLALASASGDLVVQTNNDSLNIGYAAPYLMNGALRVNASNIRLRTIGPQAFGSYEVAMNFTDQDIRYQVDKSSGTLVLQGSGNISLAAPKQFRYIGTASVSRVAPAWLPAALLAVGRPGLDGRFTIDYKTNF